MVCRLVRSTLLVLVVMAVAGWTGARTSWAETKGDVGPFEFENKTGVTVGGLKVMFAGGDITQASATGPAGCNQGPTIGIDQSGKLVTVNFGAKCIKPLEKVVVTFRTKVRPLSQVQIHAWDWTNGTQIVAGHEWVILPGKAAWGGWNSCPPTNPPQPKDNPKRDIDGDGVNDWLMGVRQVQVVDSDGSSRTLTVWIWCLQHPGGDWSFSVGKKSSRPGPPPSASMSYSPAPSKTGRKRAPNIGRAACPFPGGINSLSYWGPKGADGLPTTVLWYSKLPADWWERTLPDGTPTGTKTGPTDVNRRLIARKGTIQITTYDVAMNQFKQEWAVPNAGDPHPSDVPVVPYPPPPPPNYKGDWNKYVRDPVAADCSADDDADGLDNVGEGLRGTDSTNSDSDADGVPDGSEAALGSDPLTAASLPEDMQVPGTCTDGLDNDGDGFTDGADGGCSDTDGDGISDRRDNCRTQPNADQQDTDSNGVGDVCGDDDDGDGVSDAGDACAGTDLGESVDASGCGVDPDFDGFCAPGTSGTLCAGADNCPDTFNSLQTDVDLDGIGDSCDAGNLGGVAQYPDRPPGANTSVVAAAIATALAALAGAAWYTRRRWVR